MSINDNIAQNLNNFMKEKNISANTIAKVGCVTPSTITRFLSREIKSLNIETIQKIAAYYNEPMGKFIQELKKSQNTGSAEIITGSDIAYISFYRDIGVSAGHGLDWDSDGQILSFPIPVSFLHSKGIAPENALIVKVNGDSMSPTLNDNDLVVIDKNFSLSLNGIYVIKDNINGLRVKRLDKDKDGNLKVISDNKNYETQIYSVAEMQDNTITILGKVTAKIAGV
ncbi:MAG: helix-turn-helix domain-containing protein [Mucispirillum sp.]|uniref:Helix-turn-helix domain-containing protein n=1 Tax=Candidatus Mucispirillum faecigallinarum TaxID=2838699 RepID=A0A9D2GVC0_9BACT|nr:helix-turn-helix domain-containing protein [Mucispirillum sp.]HIZ89715.1 helix-turn-helix domain-containing protein [Candidatus Mucispirillum faecigallinarum]